MDLSNLKPAKGSTQSRKRVGRGVGSGLGGHTAGRGTKGQLSVSGGSIPAHFEGGQMPLQRRIPKFGFKNPFRTEYRAVNLSSLTQLIEQGRIDAARPITPEVLAGAGLIGKKQPVKVLGSGEVSTALNVSAHAFSGSARRKLEAAGGSASIIE
ncbi:MAG TPA: 50S ribosomal protein L15 [Rhodothermales bacterium]|nr:50S ribosomal protein L15 [Rhodothermales bacterium]